VKISGVLILFLLVSLSFADITENIPTSQNIIEYPAKVKEKTLSVEEIIKKSDELMRGDTANGSMEMIVKTKRWTRTIEMESWSKGTKKSFIRINAPVRDKGTTFLKLDKEMWQYVPKVERTIKIPPSMMMQSWMGSDFTNDDLVKESSIVDDYKSKLLGKEGNNYKVELIPRPEAAVTWGKVLYWVDIDNLLPVRVEFYDEDNLLVNVLEYMDVRRFNDRQMPAKWVMTPQDEDKEGHSTTIIVKEMVFNEPVDNLIFSLSALKKMSR